MSEPWESAEWIAHTQRMLDSYRQLLGEELISRTHSEYQQSQALYHSPRVVVSHGTQDDPLLNYGNRAALKLWEMPLADFLGTPSRHTAEPMEREERAELLERTSRDGFVDDYQGVRISQTGKRFLIERAVVWNLSNREGEYCGQAATFTQWNYIPPSDSC